MFVLDVTLTSGNEGNSKAKRALRRLVRETGLSFRLRRYAVDAAKMISENALVKCVAITRVVRYEKDIVFYRNGVPYDDWSPSR